MTWYRPRWLSRSAPAAAAQHPPAPSTRAPIPLNAEGLRRAKAAHQAGTLSSATLSAALGSDVGAFTAPQRAALREIAAHAQLGTAEQAEELAYAIALLLDAHVVNSSEARRDAAAGGEPPPSTAEE